MNLTAPETIIATLRSSLAKLLETDSSQIDTQAPFLEMGADSIVLVDAVRTIETIYGLKIPMRQLFDEVSTIETLATYIEQNLPSKASPTDFPEATNGFSPTVPYAEEGDEAFLEEILQQQLQIMSQQLELLQHKSPKRVISSQNGHSSPRPTPDIPYVTPSSLPPWRVSETRVIGLKPQQQQHLESLITQYNQRTPTSKKLTQTHRPVLADNRASAGFRFSTKEMLYPIIGVRSQGSRIWDIDGNEYIDLTMGFGVNLFGHNPPFVKAALEAQIQQGIQLGPQTHLAGEVAQLICELTGMERVSFCNSGTEAVMTAMRLARTVTGRNKIVMFAGSYHGHSDETLGMAEAGNDKPNAIPHAPGVMPGMVADVLVLEYGNPQSLQVLQTHVHELAAVIVEPVQSRRPDLQPKQFLQELRQLTQTAGIALIFDEMITGFRIHPGGCQAWFGIQADLATYGKIVGGGMPIGVIAGKAAYMDAMDGGMWNYGDASYPQVETTFFAGTFCKHPLTMAAAKAVLKEMKKQGSTMQEQLNQRTAQLAETLNAFFSQKNVPIQIVHFGSLFRFTFTGNMDLLFYHLLAKGVYVWEGRNCFLSIAHSEDDLNYLIEVVKESIEELRKGGFLGKSSNIPKSDDWYPLSISQQRFARLSQLGEGGKKAGNIGFVIKFSQEIDSIILEKAWQELVARHDCLRTVIDLAQGKQKLSDSNPTSFVEIEEDNLNDILEAQANQTFDLANGFLVKATLIRPKNSQYYFCLVAHHTVADGWSFAVLLQELFTLYQAYQDKTIPQLNSPPSYRNYVNEESHQFSEQALSYWQEQYKQYSPQSLFEPINPDVSTFLGKRLRYSVEIQSLKSQLKQISKQMKCTPFILLFSLFQSYLYQTFKKEMFIIKVPIASRNNDRDTNLIGCCVNLLPIICGKTPLEKQLKDLIPKVKQNFLEALEHQNFNYQQWLKTINHPLNLIQISFNLEPKMDLSILNNHPLELIPLPVNYVEFPLMMNILELDDRLQIELDYQIRYLNQKQAEEILNSFGLMVKHLFS
jgi:glutamate-1-semialdehyde-2,1-aminomutase